MKSIDTIEGIGPSYQEKLAAAGVETVEALLEKAGAKKGRTALAEATGISEKMILTWVNMADLFRVKGVAGQYAELLVAAGVDTVKELAQRNPESLHAKMVEANEAKNVARQVPAEKSVAGWITEAKSLPQAVTH